MANPKETSSTPNGCGEAFQLFLYLLAQVEPHIFGTQELDRFLTGNPEVQKYLEEKVWGTEDAQEVEEALIAYVHDLEGATEKPILPESLRKEHLPFITDLQKQLKGLIRRRAYLDAVVLIGNAETVIMQNGSSQHLWPLVSQQKGRLHEAMANVTKSEQARKYWLGQAIRDYAFADIFDQFATESILNNPAKVSKLLEKLNEPELTRIING